MVGSGAASRYISSAVDASSVLDGAVSAYDVPAGAIWNVNVSSIDPAGVPPVNASPSRSGWRRYVAVTCTVATPPGAPSCGCGVITTNRRSAETSTVGGTIGVGATVTCTLD